MFLFTTDRNHSIILMRTQLTAQEECTGNLVVSSHGVLPEAGSLTGTQDLAFHTHSRGSNVALFFLWVSLSATLPSPLLS